ncbi:MAG TPA: amidohydrolase family protein [Candidatus Hydrogenedentes bacterium]|nr:amidohydrolase family protein [Candidatus Hydrogenedentota bacterium]
MKRREFMQRTAGGVLATTPLAAATSSAAESPVPAKDPPQNTLDLTTLPNFCAHEHWGSIPAIGMSPEGFRADTETGAVPSRPVSVWDLVLDPYFGGFLAQAGTDPHQLATQAGAPDFISWWQKKPEEALAQLRAPLQNQALTGAFQCLRKGIAYLHGPDIGAFELEAWREADTAVANAYSDIFSWYSNAMEKIHFSGLIRPVHPEFYVREGTAASAKAELGFTHTIMRIDPLLHLWEKKSPRRDGLAKIAGVEPRDAQSWRNFITAILDLAAAHGTTGIKQLQAYSRPLRFEHRPDREIVWSGALSDEQVIAHQDWIVHECCKQANDRGWVHQIHVGTHNLTQSSPLPLQILAKRYPKMNIVMLHAWPFLSECGWLAKQYPNMYIDTCWQAILNPDFFRRALQEWLGYIPAHKLMCSHDATSIEMAAGSSLINREILSEILDQHALRIGIPPNDLQHLALSFLHTNATNLYPLSQTK